MSFRLSILTLSLGAALLTPLTAQADNYPGSRPVPSDGVKTRAAVQAELAAWRNNPVSADGWSEIGGGDTLRYVGTQTASTLPRDPAAVAAQIAEFRKNPVHANGWLETRSGNGGRFVGVAGAGRNRADVLAELDAWSRNPVSFDGYRELGGERLDRISRAAAPAGIQLAALNGFTLASGLALDEARYASTTTDAAVDNMQVRPAAKQLGEGKPAAAAKPAPQADFTKDQLYLLFSARR